MEETFRFIEKFEISKTTWNIFICRYFPEISMIEVYIIFMEGSTEIYRMATFFWHTIHFDWNKILFLNIPRRWTVIALKYDYRISSEVNHQVKCKINWKLNLIINWNGISIQIIAGDHQRKTEAIYSHGTSPLEQIVWRGSMSLISSLQLNISKNILKEKSHDNLELLTNRNVGNMVSVFQALGRFLLSSSPKQNE